MASESAINGTFVPQNGYGSIDQSGYTAPSYPSSAPSQSNNSAADIPKDEVGWYFVEQYYTTLSRSPEKVYELDFSECKVRVTNVDSQASDEHIVIQVIGEISNKSAPHKKFTQTFVLAAQTNGYFATEESAAIQEPAPTAVQEPEHETLTSSEDPVAIEKDAAKVDKEIEEKIIADKPEETAAPTAVVNDLPKAEAAEPAQAEAPAADVPEPTETPDAAPEAATEAASEVPVAQALETEKPKDPEPTPAVRSPVKQAAQPAKAAAPVKPAAPAAPAAPKTWANLAAAAHRVATPVVTPQPSTSAAPVQPKTAPQPEPAAKPTPAAPAQEAAPAPAPESSPAAPSADQQEEWTSVGDKKQNKGQAAAGAQDTPQYRTYVKNVHESITLPTLREAIEKYGEIVYFDANRPKTIDGYKAALKASPISIGEHAITIEERRPKDNRPYYPGNRGGARGGRGGANQAPRGSFQGGRGGGSQRGRGGAASRGRGGAQAA
ncbi:unnamed protein product [Aureobasidium mustum]|uniref:NTF2 domain-containing protein n=1 Tax=Aureobasidium mustum TaxID=2773714 RepID=A0A9N8JQ51_9PEZI|nr:unnamed protein product [Aureobasidium mustum]